MKPRALSLRRTLLLGILLPVFGYVVFNTVVLYRQALAAADTAYDRTLLATAKSLGEQLQVTAQNGEVHVQATVLYSALEDFGEADTPAIRKIREAATLVDSLLNVDLTAQITAIEELRCHHEALIRHYDN